MIQRLLKLKYILLSFVLTQIAIIIILVVSENYDRTMFLDNKTRLAQIAYETVYRKTKEQSQIIFHEKINVKEIIDIFKKAHTADEQTQDKIRTELHDTLQTSYTRLKKLINLRQLHFHLPNNHSFLRMHRPNKSGDDLSEIRATVAYVNNYKKPIDGFEEGRIYNGFRFVYPLFDENNTYIGSVEVSFSALSFQKTLSHDAQFSQFLFSKEVIEEKVWKDEYELNYIKAEINPKFLLETQSFNDEFSHIKMALMKNMSTRVKNDFKKYFSTEKAFSLHVHVDKEIYTISFLPIKNPVTHNLTAYIGIVTKSTFLSRLHFENDLFKAISFAFSLALFIIIYLYKKNDDDIQEQKELLLEQSKMAQMGSMLSNIAHQWKQPLAQINAKLVTLPLALDLNKEKSEILDTHIDKLEDLTLFMADTIENFRTYFSPDKEKVYFNLISAIDKSISIINLDPKIQVEISGDTSLRVYCFENELIQVFITMLINAKEALMENKIDEPYIKIDLIHNLSVVEILIIDNAGGIDNKTYKQIFHPYFSTKTSEKNTGIGLYMAKTIIDGMQGSLSYTRVNNESHFKITLKGLEHAWN